MAKLNKFTKFITVELLIIVLLLIFISIFNHYTKSQYLIEGFWERDEVVETTGAGGDHKLTLFYADWCGHCKTMKPEWDKFKNGKYGKHCKDYESKEITSEMSEKYGVKGYPTILLLKEDVVVTKYEGGRDVGSFEEFIKEYIVV